MPTQLSTSQRVQENSSAASLNDFSVVFHTGRWLDFEDTSPALRDLVDQMPQFCLASKASTTQRSYRYAFNSFCKWCLSKNIYQTLPASDVSVSTYFIHLTNLGKSTSSINEAFYAISWAHKLAGLQNLCESDLVRTVKEGALRSVGHYVVKKEPITPEIMVNLVERYGNSRSNLKDLRIACMCLISYAGFLRFAELANLKRNNLQFFDSYVRIFLESSKTDV